MKEVHNPRGALIFFAYRRVLPEYSNPLPSIPEKKKKIHFYLNFFPHKNHGWISLVVFGLAEKFSVHYKKVVGILSKTCINYWSLMQINQNSVNFYWRGDNFSTERYSSPIIPSSHHWRTALIKNIESEHSSAHFTEAEVEKLVTSIWNKNLRSTVLFEILQYFRSFMKLKYCLIRWSDFDCQRIVWKIEIADWNITFKTFWSGQL